MEILAEGEHYGRLELQGKTRETEGGTETGFLPIPSPFNLQSIDTLFNNSIRT